MRRSNTPIPNSKPIHLNNQAIPLLNKGMRPNNKANLPIPSQTPECSNKGNLNITTHPHKRSILNLNPYQDKHLIQRPLYLRHLMDLVRPLRLGILHPKFR